MTPKDQYKDTCKTLASSKSEAEGEESSISEEELYLMEHAYA